MKYRPHQPKGSILSSFFFKLIRVSRHFFFHSLRFSLSSLLTSVPILFRSYRSSIHVLLIPQFPLFYYSCYNPSGCPYWFSLSSSNVPCSFPPQVLCICCSLYLEHSFLSPNSFNPLLLRLANTSSFSRSLSILHIREATLDSQAKLYPFKHVVPILLKPTTSEISYQVFFFVRL